MVCNAVGFAKIFLPALDKGVYFSPNAYEVGFVSLAHTEKVLTETLDRLQGALNK